MKNKIRRAAIMLGITGICLQLSPVAVHAEPWQHSFNQLKELTEKQFDNADDRQMEIRSFNPFADNIAELSGSAELRRFERRNFNPMIKTLEEEIAQEESASSGRHIFNSLSIETLTVRQEVVSEPETEALVEVEAEPETEEMAEAATEPETEVVAEAETEPETEEMAEAVTESETEVVAEAETEPETEVVTEAETESEPEPEPSVEDEIYRFLTTEMGFNTAAACGIIANIACESEFDPMVYGDEGFSYGLCQWYRERFENLRAYCEENAFDYSSVDGQMHFLQYELLTISRFDHVLSYLYEVPETAQGAYDAAFYWCYYFEVPEGYNTTESPRRAEIAVDTYWEKYQDLAGTGQEDE